MNASEVIQEIIDREGINANALAVRMGLKRTQPIYDLINGKIKKISSTYASMIVEAFPKYNLSWLLTGEGDICRMDMGDLLDRINEMSEAENVTISFLERQIGASKGVLSRAIANKTDIHAKWVQSIVENYPHISAEWLLTGRGEMLKSDQIQVISHPKSVEMKLEEQNVILYDISAAANLKTLLADKTQNILGVISIPDMPRCDGAICVTGDSMYPLLKSGDIVAYKELQDFSNVIFGEIYLVSFEIEGDEFLVVKYVNRSEMDGYIKLVSYNTHHDPRDIPISSVNAMALVKLSIRKNVMR